MAANHRLDLLIDLELQNSQTQKQIFNEETCYNSYMNQLNRTLNGSVLCKAGE